MTMKAYNTISEVPNTFNGPCYVKQYKSLYCLKPGKIFHCETGPAIIFDDGRQEWFVNGKRHRLDGPAIKFPSTEHWNEYYINGIEFSKEDYNNHPDVVAFKNNANKTIVDNFKTEPMVSGMKTFKTLHHACAYEGTCVSESNQTQYTLKKGLIFHNENGPAVVRSNGDKLWYKNGRQHRLDGPAVVYANGEKEYLIEGKPYAEKEYNNHPAVVAFKNRANKQEKMTKERVDGPGIKVNFPTKESYEKVVKEIETIDNEPNKVMLQNTAEVKDKDNTMMNNATVKGINLKSESRAAAKRTTCRNVVKLSRALLIEALTKGASPEQKETLTALVAKNLDTELGKALIGGIGGIALNFSQGVLPAKVAPYAAEAAEELRIEAMSVVGDVVSDGLAPMFAALPGMLSAAFEPMIAADEKAETTRLRVGGFENNETATAEAHELNRAKAEALAATQR